MQRHGGGQEKCLFLPVFVSGKGGKSCSEKVAFSQPRAKYLDPSWRSEFKPDCIKVYRGALHIKEFAIRKPFLYLER